MKEAETIEVAPSTLNTVIDELNRVATTATKERAVLAEEALADIQEEQ